MKKIFVGILFCQLLLLTAAYANQSIKPQGKMRCLYDAYHQYIKKIVKDRKGNIYFVMQNGVKLIWNDHQHKSFAEKLNNPDLKDVVSQKYPYHRNINIKPSFNDDPGRFRNEAFLQAVYGNSPAQVKNNMIKVKWLKGAKVSYVLFNKRNGAAKALANIVKALNNLPTKYKKYVDTIAGTYKWRNIAGTHDLSAHSYGIAIDINTQYSNYWRWDNKGHLKQRLRYINKIPEKIVNIFEKNGFIWGGRWYHYDTMHFEYRPEFMQQQCKK